MPVISMFYGIIVHMYSESGGRHKKPHIHCTYGGEEAVFDFDGFILEGELPANKVRLVEAWIELHKDELYADWELLSKGEQHFRISPLK